MVVYTASLPGSEEIPTCTSYLITRSTQSSQSFITFQLLPEPCFPSNSKRSPPFYFINRLRDFPPDLQDLIIVTTTTTADVGLLSRCKVPLTANVPADAITNKFTTTKIANEVRRATLPMSGDLDETSAIGVALDLSSKENVKHPLPGEEPDESPTPLPAFMILNEEGVLSSWWLIYADSIRKNTAYPGLVVNRHPEQHQLQTSHQGLPFVGSNLEAIPAFSKATLGNKPPASGTFDNFTDYSAPAFGSISTLGLAFPGNSGTSSGFEKPVPSWGTTGSNNMNPQSTGLSSGQLLYGSAPASGGSPQGVTFGMTGGIGNRGSPWATQSPGTTGNQNTVFGQPGGLGMQSGSLFGNGSAGKSLGSSLSIPSNGFASFAKAPGFGAAAAQGGGESIFAKATPGASFGSGMETDTIFSETPQNKTETSGGPFQGGGFTLGSTFIGDGTAKDDLPKPARNPSDSLFGDNIDQTLEGSQANVPIPDTQEAEMDDSLSEDDESSQGFIGRDSTSPADAPGVSKFPATTPPQKGGLFGTQAQSQATPAAVQNSTPATLIFGKSTPPSTTPEETPKKRQDAPFVSIENPTPPMVKSEPKEDSQVASDETTGSPLEAPLPPESTSKASYAVGDSSNSSKSSADDAPLPPDFLPSKSKIVSPQWPQDNEPILPADDDDILDDDEGSGVDVAQEISPITDPNQSPKVTPGSSFGASFDKISSESLFTKVPRQQAPQSEKGLFGEINSNSIPHLPPPSKTHESPRSPSPVRPFSSLEILRPDNSRSVSAPGPPGPPGPPHRAIANRKFALSQATRESPYQSLVEEQRRKEREFLAAKQVQKMAEEQQSLSDEEDEMVREELKTEAEATLTLDPFLAHQNYVGKVGKSGIPGQIETIYRDINSMIDTLGINARSLAAFTRGHSELYQEGGRSRDDLEKDNWCLSEIDDLNALEDEFSEQLQKGCAIDHKKMLHTCRSFREKLHKTRAKRHEIMKNIQLASDPELAETARSAPLSPEQYLIQQDLRKDFLRIQKLIAKAEEGISTLRVLLASCESSNGKTTPLKKPTVEAVTSTIKKMTSMAEKKSLDVDVLEAQMRKLGFSSLQHPISREESPFAASSLSSEKNAFSATIKQDIYHLPGGYSTTLRASIGQNGSPRKRLADLSRDEVERFALKFRQRKQMNEIVKKALLESGPRIRTLD